MEKSHHVQYGCGWSAPEGWRNFDASPTLRFERLPLFGKLYTKNESRFPENVEHGDIVKGLPVAAGTCKGVYSSHVLEHLSLEDFRVALRNSHRLLVEGGVFRIVLPDLEHCARKYLEDGSSDASLKFMKDTFLGIERRPRGLRSLVKTWLGNSQHLWMWDYKSIVPELEAAGFKRIRRAVIGDSADSMFALVENPQRWEDSLGLECVRSN